MIERHKFITDKIIQFMQCSRQQVYRLLGDGTNYFTLEKVQRGGGFLKSDYSLNRIDKSQVTIPSIQINSVNEARGAVFHMVINTENRFQRLDAGISDLVKHLTINDLSYTVTFSDPTDTRLGINETPLDIVNTKDGTIDDLIDVWKYINKVNKTPTINVLKEFAKEQYPSNGYYQWLISERD